MGKKSVYFVLQQVSETEPKVTSRPRKNTPSFLGDKRKSDIAQGRQTDDENFIDAGPAPQSKEVIQMSHNIYVPLLGCLFTFLLLFLRYSF